VHDERRMLHRRMPGRALRQQLRGGLATSARRRASGTRSCT
jgi:hypothetical protein